MPLSRSEILQNVADFAERWKDETKWNEKSYAQSFVRDLLAVFGVDAIDKGKYERRLGDGFADYLLPKKIAVEMKSHGGNLENAYEQLWGYLRPLEREEFPDLLLVSDFENIILYYRPGKTKKEREPIEFKTKDLRDYIEHFHTLAGFEQHYELTEQYEVNVRAAEKMARLHDDLERLGYEGHVLEIYLVRLLFCLFAEDTGIFPQDSFLSYVTNSKEDGTDLSARIVRLFDVLNMPDEMRTKRTQLPPDLREFRYINGGLFNDPLPPADFDDRMRLTLIDCSKFDWSKISPAIFGAMFQGVMDKTQRRELGAHYTDEENILKLIDPLFMDDLRAELKRVKADEKRLDNFHEKIAKLKFLDPACGCGNFLMIAYRELRLLEIEVLRIKMERRKKSRQKVLDISILLKVNVDQFYGIEIEDFPCEVARVSLWLMDHLMNRQATAELGQYYIRLPLTQSATIAHGNALRIDWETIVSKDDLAYIISNPPYVGYQYRNDRQKEDMRLVFSGTQNIDYVAAWYYKAAKMMAGTTIRTAFVSTNSITQGEQVVAVWKPLIEKFGVHIDFAYRSFRWKNEAKGKAAVYCVIIGFNTGLGKNMTIYDGEAKITANNINPYLVDAPNIFIENRSKPLHDVPEMHKGNEMYDDQNLVIEAEEYEGFIQKEPLSVKYIKRYMGSDEFINNQVRYCLWLLDCPPHELRKMPLVKQRIEAVKEFRLHSKRESTKKTASTPTTFSVIHQPTTNYILFPVISSEKRDYIPIGFLTPETIVSYAVFTLSNASLYHFGILTSSVHMAWTRAICGRLEMRYRYSNKIVYNNFPWADTTDAQKEHVEKLAQGILDARAMFPDSSLADLYDPLTMPKELSKAHQALDRAVMKLYRFKKDMPESAIVAALMEMYQKLTAPPTLIPEPQPKKPRKSRKVGGKK